MENVERIYELLEAIEKTYVYKILPLDVRLDVLEILEEDLIQDLERILDKINFYYKVTNE